MPPGRRSTSRTRSVRPCAPQDRGSPSPRRPRVNRRLKRLTSAVLDLCPRVERKVEKMRIKKPGPLACLALAIAMPALPVAASASPVRGAWNGRETKYWTGSTWKRIAQNLPVSFRVGRGKVVRFRTGGIYRWPGCTGGETVTARLPVSRTARVRHGRFRGKRTTYVGSRKMTTHVSGRFTSARGARGRIFVTLAGCPTYRSVWTASRPKRRRGGGIIFPICRGQNILMPDGSYYYNPCVYVA